MMFLVNFVFWTLEHGGYLHLSAGSGRLAQEWQTHIDGSIQQMVLLIRVKQSCKADNLSVSPCRNNPNGIYSFEKSCVMKDSILLGKLARVYSGDTLSWAFLLSTCSPPPFCFNKAASLIHPKEIPPEAILLAVYLELQNGKQFYSFSFLDIKTTNIKCKLQLLNATFGIFVIFPWSLRLT